MLFLGHSQEYRRFNLKRPMGSADLVDALERQRDKFMRRYRDPTNTSAMTDLHHAQVFQSAMNEARLKGHIDTLELQLQQTREALAEAREVNFGLPHGEFSAASRLEDPILGMSGPEVTPGPPLLSIAQSRAVPHRRRRQLRHLL